MNQKLTKNTFRVDKEALKSFLSSYEDWSFVDKLEINRWAHNSLTPRYNPYSFRTDEDQIFDSEIKTYVENCIAMAKRNKWVRSRRGYRGKYQKMPIYS